MHGHHAWVCSRRMTFWAGQCSTLVQMRLPCVPTAMPEGVRGPQPVWRFWSGLAVTLGQPVLDRPGPIGPSWTYMHSHVSTADPVTLAVYMHVRRVCSLWPVLAHITCCCLPVGVHPHLVLLCVLHNVLIRVSVSVPLRQIPPLLPSLLRNGDYLLYHTSYHILLHISYRVHIVLYTAVHIVPYSAWFVCDGSWVPAGSVEYIDVAILWLQGDWWMTVLWAFCGGCKTVPCERRL